MRSILLPICTLILVLIAACASKEEHVPDQTTKDDLLTAVFYDYIANMPEEPTARGRKAFYVTAGREEISPSVLRRLQRRWPTLISRDDFDRRYGNMEASWGFYGAEIRSYSPTRALVETWSSRPYETSRLYQMERQGEAWLVKSSVLHTAPLNLKGPRKRPSPTPTPMRPFYP